MSNFNMLEAANEHITILHALGLLGVEVPEAAYGRSVKVHCPFGFAYHSDGGISRSMRAYTDTNSAYCFSCARYYTPTSLLARGWDRSEQDIAQDIVEKNGVGPKTLRERWDAASTSSTTFDRTHLVQALRMFCARVDPEWDMRQFSPPYSTYYNKCLELTDVVDSVDSGRDWLEKSKQVMQLVLTKERAT